MGRSTESVRHRALYWLASKSANSSRKGGGTTVMDKGQSSACVEVDAEIAPRTKRAQEWLVRSRGERGEPKEGGMEKRVLCHDKSNK